MRRYPIKIWENLKNEPNVAFIKSLIFSPKAGGIHMGAVAGNFKGIADTERR